MKVRVIPYLLTLVLACGVHAEMPEELPSDYVAGELVELNDNGAWSWFMDERAIVDRGRLIVGSVRAVGNFNSGQDDPNWGNVELSVYDIESGQVDRVVLHQHLEQDDHNVPALFVRPDGRYLAVYTKHGVDKTIRWRISESDDPLTWGPHQEIQTPGKAGRFHGDSVTYSNLFRFPDGTTYNFHRGYDFDPNYLVSQDDGTTWQYGGRLLHGRDGYSPYLKYAYDGQGTLHFIATEDHPRNFDNSIYHGYLRDGQVHHSDGRVIAPLSETTDTQINAWDLTPVFVGDPDNVAWTVDLEVDSCSRLYAAISIQCDGRDLPPQQGGMDLRYIYARWDGNEWHVHPMAYAGTRLYPWEDDYSGLVALHPHDPSIVYISTDADPVTGEPLISSADGKRHHELYYGRSNDQGESWQWEPITANSTVDNLRPIVPKWNEPRTALVWMRGAYMANRGQWTTAVVALILPSEE